MIVLLWRGGLRSFEACALETGDLEETETSGLRLHIKNGKGGKARWVGVDKRAADLIVGVGNRSQKRARQGAGGLRPSAVATILRTRSGRSLQTSSVRRSVSRIASSAGIARRVHPHCLRHTCARDLHDEGFSVREIQVFLGHESLETTQQYLTSIGCDAVVAAATRREW